MENVNKKLLLSNGDVGKIQDRLYGAEEKQEIHEPGTRGRSNGVQRSTKNQYVDRKE